MWKFYLRKRRATDKGRSVLDGRGLVLSDWQEIKARRPTCKKKVKTKPWHRLSAFIARTNGLMCWNREWRNNNELLALFYCSFEWIKRPSEKKVTEKGGHGKLSFFSWKTRRSKDSYLSKRSRLMPAFNGAESFIYQKLSRLHNFAFPLLSPHSPALRRRATMEMTNDLNK